MYNTPDNHWIFYKIDTFEQFVNRFVVKGKFHKDVPDDIKKEYKTVEYLMASAYYHAPLYDEAENKILRLFEAAIKIKAKQDCIDLKYTTGRRSREKNLKTLIDDIFSSEDAKEFNKKLHTTRNIRNFFIHKDDYSPKVILGNTLHLIKQYVVILNSIFYNNNRFGIHERGCCSIITEFENLKNRPFIVHNSVKPLLIYNPKIITVTDKTLILAAIPVINTEQHVVGKFDVDPYIVSLTNYSFCNNTLKGVSSDVGETIIYETTDCRNIDMYKQNRAFIDSNNLGYDFSYDNNNIKRSIWEFTVNQEYNSLEET